MTIGKSKRVVSFLLAAIMMLALSAFFCVENAFADHNGDWEYEVTSQGAKITGYLGNNWDITIPAKLDDGTVVYSVSGLGLSAKAKATSITFSSGIKAIENNAFNSYEKLTTVTFNGNTVTSIGSSAFENCTKLTAITLPSSVTSIGTSAFSGCTSLNTAVMKCRLQELPAKIFYGCKSLNTVTTSYYITTIGNGAFEQCSSLKAINLASGLTTIGSDAFNGCTSLLSPTFPDTLITIGNHAYKGCTSITSIFIPNSVRNINEGAFYNCSGLNSAYISASVKKMERNVFTGCSSLSKVVFGGANGGFNNMFDIGANPTIYFPASQSSSWSEFTVGKRIAYKSYTATPSKTSINLDVNKGETLKVNVSSDVADLGNAYILSSSNPAVATVTSTGYVQAKTPGETTINITTVMGNTKTVKVKVAPSAPASAKAITKSTASITVKWSKGNASGYEIYRSTSKTKGYKKVATTTSSEYVDKGLKKGTTYYYKVRAYAIGTSGKVYSGYSKVVSAKATSPTPSSITATKSKSGVASIKWAKSAGANGYEVYMAKSKNGSYSKIYTATKSTTVSYKKSGLTKGKTYYFKVRSYVTVGGKKVYSDFTTVKSVKV